jgi:hypothetical protein
MSNAPGSGSRLGTEGRSTVGQREGSESGCGRRNSDPHQRPAVLAVCRRESIDERITPPAAVFDHYNRSH